MSTKGTKFLAARLWDETHKFGISYHEVDISSRESVLEAAENIKKENHTPDQISGILGVILAAASEKLTEEDLDTVFQGVAKAENDEPYTINIDTENFPLIYSALNELISVDSVEETEEPKVDYTEELTRLQCIDEAVVPYQNFSIAEEDTEWDESKAIEQIKAKSTDSDGNINWETYRKAFLYCTKANVENEASYKFPIAYSEEGFKVVPKALEAVVTSLSKSKIAVEDKSAIKSILIKYFNKMEKDIPDSIKSESFDTEAIESEIETRLDQAVEEKTKEIQTTLDTKQEELSRLEKTVLKLSTEKHEMLAREAAHVALKSGYPAAKGKTFDTLVESFVTRSTDSLEDLIKDLLPLEESVGTEKVTIDPASVEKVTNPVSPTETAIPEQMKEPVPGETPLQTELANQVVDTEEDSSKYLLLNFSPKETEDLKSHVDKIRRGVLGS